MLNHTQNFRVVPTDLLRGCFALPLMSTSGGTSILYLVISHYVSVFPPSLTRLGLLLLLNFVMSCHVTEIILLDLSSNEPDVGSTCNLVFDELII